MKRFNFMTWALMLTVSLCMTFTSCKKDSNTSGDDPEPGDNPFVGTWYSTEYEDLTIEFKTAKWAMKDEGYSVMSGTYTYSGKTATLTVTDAYDEDVIGEKATAKISGNTLTLTDPDGDTMEFTKDDDPPPPPPPGGAQVRFKKAQASGVSIMTVDYPNDGDEVVRHEFGYNAETSPYYEIPAEKLIPYFYYDGDDYNEEGWYYCLDAPHTYNFKEGHRYTIVIDLESEELVEISDDGTFKSGNPVQIPVNSNIEKKVVRTLKR